MANETAKLDLKSSRFLEALEKELNHAAPGVVITRDPATGRIWYQWPNKRLDEIEKARIRIVLSKHGLLNIAAGGLWRQNGNDLLNSKSLLVKLSMK